MGQSGIDLGAVPVSFHEGLGAILERFWGSSGENLGVARGVGQGKQKPNIDIDK